MKPGKARSHFIPIPRCAPQLPPPWLGLGITSGLLILYAGGLPAGLTWAHWGADGGDLATAILRGSLPHPPGFPAYLLLGDLFIRLPWGEPAWRLNLLSAVLAASAAGLMASSTRHPPLVRISVGLLLGSAPLFWSQALITEVYAPAAFGTALTLYLLQRGAPGWAIGLAWGAGLGLHPTLIFLAPLVLSGTRPPRSGLLPTILAATGMTLLLYGPLLLIRGQKPFPWGELQSLAGWWAYISARLYQHYPLALPLTALPSRLLAWGSLLVRQFTPVGALLTGSGWLAWRREHPALAWTSGAAFLIWSGYAIGYNTADSLVYLVPALPLAAFWLLAGAGQAQAGLGARWGQWGQLALLVLPLGQVFWWGPQVTLQHDRSASAWAEATLAAAPSEAVLITAQDGHTFALWYAQAAWNQRPDVVVVDRDLWAQPAYRRLLAEPLGPAVLGPGCTPEQAAQQDQRPWQSIAPDISSETK